MKRTQLEIERSEARWPPGVAVLVAALLFITLPPHLTLGPTWLMPLLIVALDIPLLVSGPIRQGQSTRVRRAAAITMFAIVNAANIASLSLLVRTLLNGYPKETGSGLLYAAAAIWLTNILVFALWYWELDRGGPQARLSASHRDADFLFPQMVTPECAPVGWLPSFGDYLYIGITNATALSPADTMPLSTWAKGLMTCEALISLLTIALVAAHAVGILA